MQRAHLEPSLCHRKYPSPVWETDPACSPVIATRSFVALRINQIPVCSNRFLTKVHIRIATLDKVIQTAFLRVLALRREYKTGLEIMALQKFHSLKAIQEQPA